MAITAKELLELNLGEGVTLSKVFDIYDGESQFGTYTGEDGHQYSLGSKDGFYEMLAQKIIDATTKER